ncbi:MAG: GNAT family N-acetyltransferase [Alphaproteobacteria bacterium]|nr:MAG: GNAT family N-acetyltransferase [Alphaproteobacteria bacterium]
MLAYKSSGSSGVGSYFSVIMLRLTWMFFQVWRDKSTSHFLQDGTFCQRPHRMISIRLASDRDYDCLPAIEADAGRLFHEFGLPSIASMEPMPADYYRNLPQKSAVFVALRGSEHIGFAVGIAMDGQGYLKEVSVKRLFAGQGVGRRLVECVMTWAQSASFRYLALTTFRDLPFNAAFYTKLGFHEFIPDHNWPTLQNIRAHEQTSGVEIQPRVAMRLDLRNQMDLGV